jgi:HTH-type transcriptional regulator/antitoxin HigA
MNIRPIRTENDYEAALARIETLWDAAPGSAEEADELEVLATLVDVYDEEHEPIPPPDPVEAILFRLEQSGRTRKDLEEILGVERGRVSEILNRRRGLSLSMIRKLTRSMDIPADVLIG